MGRAFTELQWNVSISPQNIAGGLWSRAKLGWAAKAASEPRKCAAVAIIWTYIGWVRVGVIEGY